MLLRVVDFETTGIPTDTEKHSVVEIGFVDVVDLPKHREGENVQFGIRAPSGTLVNPGRPIPVEAMAVHHIRDADVIGAPSPDVAFLSLAGADVFVAHNAAFERQFFTGGTVPWICTYRCARHVWPDAPSHRNQVLRYFLNLHIDPVLAMPPHRAGPDAYITAHILRALLEVHAVDELVRLTEAPVLLRRVAVGKYRGRQWSEMDSGYLEWAPRQDFDMDVKHTARHHLNKIRGGAV
jgi:exodeoxyribonuclease X